MPFKGNRIYWVIAGVIVLALIIGGSLLASSGTPPADLNPSPTPPPDSMTVTVTVMNNIGVQQISIKNLNTGKTYIATLISLPLQFNCTRGDYLKITVTTDTGYKWNAWWFSPMGIWNNDNPAIISADGLLVANNQMVMIPNTLILGENSTETFTG